MQAGSKVYAVNSFKLHKFQQDCFFLGFRRLRDFVVTQHPMESTIKDFWQMIWDHNAQTIVLLSPIDDPVSSCHSYDEIKNYLTLPFTESTSILAG